jgi:hypothetical protein
MVIELVAKFGVKSWSLISTHLTGRLGKQCRERWYNHLSPKISKIPWTLEEDRVIVEVNSYTFDKYLLYCVILHYYSVMLHLVINGLK